MTAVLPCTVKVAESSSATAPLEEAPMHPASRLAPMRKAETTTARIVIIRGNRPEVNIVRLQKWQIDKSA
jgi:hypothetical protein